MKKLCLLIVMSIMFCACGCNNQTNVMPQQTQIEFQSMKTNTSAAAQIPIRNASDYATGNTVDDIMLELCFIGASDKDAFFFTKVQNIDGPPIPEIYSLNIATNDVAEIPLDNDGYISAAYYMSKQAQILVIQSDEYMERSNQAVTCYQMPAGEKKWELEIEGGVYGPILDMEDGYAFGIRTGTASPGSEILWVGSDGSILKQINQEDAQQVCLLSANENEVLLFHIAARDFQMEQKLIKVKWSGKTTSSTMCENAPGIPIFLSGTETGNYFLAGKGPIDNSSNTFTDGYAIYTAKPNGDFYETVTLGLPQRDGCAIRFMGAQQIGDACYLTGTYNSIEAEALASGPYSEQQFVIEFDKDFQVKSSWIYDISGWKWSTGVVIDKDGKKHVIATEKNEEGDGFNLYSWSLTA